MRHVGTNGLLVATTWLSWEVEKACEVEANKDKKRSAAARKKDEFINRNPGRKNGSVCHRPCCNVLSVEGLVGHMTNSPFGYRRICNPLTYREVSGILSVTQRPIKTGL